MELDRQPTGETWDRFVAAVPHAPFLQSWAWAEFQAAVGRPVFRWLVRDRARAVSALQGFVHRYPFGFASLYVPHGPVSDGSVASAAWDLHLKGLQAEAMTRQALFVRLEPLMPLPDGVMPVRQVPSVQPPATLWIDLHQTEPALLNAMHQKTRYNIKLAEKRGVTVESGGREFLPDFAAVLRQTERRQGVRFFRSGYFRILWSVPALAGLTRIYRARLQGETLAALLVIRYGDTATYLHGGSSDRGREHMAPYALQWAAIRQAKADGAAWYDWRGVAPRDADPHHPWAGFSRFKRGFGGVDVAYPGTYDWVRRPFFYFLYRLAQRMK